MNPLSLSKLDPRCKLLMMACLTTVAMMTREIYVLGLLIFLTLGTLIFGGVEWGEVFFRIKGILVLIFSLFLIQALFTRSGGAFLSIEGHVIITVGGFHQGVYLCLRLLIVILSAQIILEGEERDYLLALIHLKLPYEIAFAVMAGIHFLPILREEALNVFYSVQLRGTELKKTKLLKKVGLYGKICLPILINAIHRSKEMSIAMEARGLRAYPARTYMRRLKLKRKDVFVMLLYPAVTAAIYLLPYFK